MKFLCGSCRTKYQISDEKIRGKILTIRCKKCGAKVVVRESLGARNDAEPVIAPLAEAVGGGSLSAAYESSVASQTASGLGLVNPDPGSAAHEWYVAVEGQQHGPFGFSELTRRIQSGEVKARHYAWHDGMADWQRVREVPDLEPYLPVPPVPKAVPPPPPLEENAGAEVLAFSRPEGPQSAIAHARTAEQEGGEALAIPFDEDDIFANVPRASQQELVQNESTRFFVRAAGVPNEKKRTRYVQLAASVAALLLAGFVGLWASGVISVPLPVLGNPFQGAASTTAVTFDGEAAEGNYGLLLGQVEMEPASAKRTRKRAGRRRAEVAALPAPGELPELGDFVDEEDEGRAGARARGQNQRGAVSIGRLGSKLDLKMPKEPTSRLPKSDLSVPVPDADELSMAMVQRVVRSHRGAATACFEKALKAGEETSGRMVVGIVVLPTGRVSDAQILDADNEGVLGECVLRSVRGWVFPSFRGESQEIELPFGFKKG